MEYVEPCFYRGYERSESAHRTGPVMFSSCSFVSFVVNPKKASAAAEASIKLAALLLGLCGFGCLGLAGIGLGVFATEALDASGSIHQLLLAGKERVAVRADFQVNGALMGGPGGKCVSACAVHFCFFVLRMDCWLHCL